MADGTGLERPRKQVPTVVLTGQERTGICAWTKKDMLAVFRKKIKLEIGH
jgi:hypothetical protein